MPNNKRTPENDYTLWLKAIINQPGPGGIYYSTTTSISYTWNLWLSWHMV
jgi:hypothetical protein